MKKSLLLVLLLVLIILVPSIKAFAHDDDYYYDYDYYNSYHPYHQHHHDYNQGGYVYCPVCGLYHYSNHPHFHGYGPVVVEHGREVMGETVTETREIVE